VADLCVQLTPEAADILVEKYRILRQDDATGAGRHSYRITVRQLESMIRLSEAIARANCTAEITPAFVREAYTLLRQSIIHVEQDDIDFDEEELEGEREARTAAPNATSDAMDESQDIEMSAAEMESMDQMEESSLGMGLNRTATSSGAGPSSTSRAGSLMPDAPPPPAPAPKRRMIITHDKYMTLQSLVVLHLSAVERETGRGVDRDELIDWYLELKESEMQDVDELEYEKELISKLLRKLVKVRYSSVSPCHFILTSHSHRTTT
jgi:DNA replication licensing factor MCM6